MHAIFIFGHQKRKKKKIELSLLAEGFFDFRSCCISASVERKKESYFASIHRSRVVINKKSDLRKCIKILWDSVIPTMKAKQMLVD